jgi:hypothetical protein
VARLKVAPYERRGLGASEDAPYNRRGSGASRGLTTPPAPLTFKLAGVTYAHALPLVSDGDLAIDLAGAATCFVAMVGVDEGAPPHINIDDAWEGGWRKGPNGRHDAC